MSILYTRPSGRTCHRQSLHLLRDLLRHDVLHEIRRMQAVEPEVLVDRDAARRIESIQLRRTVGVRIAVRRRVLVVRGLRVGGRVLEHLREDAVRIVQEHRHVPVRVLHVGCQGGEAVVEVLDVAVLRGLDLGALCDGQGREVDGRHVEQEEVAGAGLVEFLQQAGVDVEDGVEDGGRVGLVVGVADVVDAEEGGEEGVGRGPVRVLLPLDVVREELLIHLLPEAEHLRLVGLDQGRIHGGAAVGEVVGQDPRLVVFERELVDPARPVDGGVAWVGWIAQGHRRARLGHCHVEAGCCVGISAGNLLADELTYTGRRRYKTKALLMPLNPGQYFPARCARAFPAGGAHVFGGPWGLSRG